MKVTKEIVEKAVADYGYEDYAMVVEKPGEIIIKFGYDKPQMDLIFAISGIVQSIIEDSGINPQYADYVWVDITKKYINIRFNEETLANA